MSKPRRWTRIHKGFADATDDANKRPRWLWDGDDGNASAIIPRPRIFRGAPVDGDLDFGRSRRCELTIIYRELGDDE